MNKEDVSRLLNYGEVLEIVERAFKEKALGRVQMPPKQYLFFNEYNGDLRVMPAYMPSLKIAGVKIVNSHPGNPKLGLPTVMAIIELVSPETGAPQAIIDGTLITAARTGAASGVATKYLAREDSEVLSIVGAGAQSYTQYKSIRLVRDIRLVRVYDINLSSAERLKNLITRDEDEVKVKICSTVRECVEGCDILVTATPSRSPIVRLEWVSPGTHVNAIGADAPGKQELDPRILLKSKVVVDDYDQTSHSGEINVPLKQGIYKREMIYGELGEIVAGVKPGRTSDHEITVFDSTGLAILDIATGVLIFKKALDAGVGVKISGLGV